VSVARAPRPAKAVDVYTSKTEASAVVQALERAWWTIRENHPDLPPVVIVVGPGDGGRRRVWGHFAPERWGQRGDVARTHEILIAGESLARPAVETLGTLLHEAAHVLAQTRKLQDTSRGHRYHNRRYKALAEEMGLDVALADKIGWSATTVRPLTAQRYAAEVEALDAAQAAMRRAFRVTVVAEKDEKARAGRVKLQCQCPRSISVAPGVAAEGSILCGVCESEFVE